MNRSMLITGAAGFIGRNLAPAAINAGWNVTGIDRAAIAGATPLDLADAAKTREAVERAAVDAVVHLAFDPPRDEGDFERSLRSNSAIFRNLVDAAPGALFVIPGSAAEYGNTGEGRISEGTPTNAVSAYGRIKVALEHQALAGLGNVVWLRNFNIFGPGQPRGYPIADWVAQVARLEREGGGTMRVGQLEVVRDFLDVRDVAEAYLSVTDLPAGTVMNVCSGEGVALSQILDQLLDLTSAEIAVVRDEQGTRASAVPSAVGDPTRLRAATGWTPRFSLLQTLTDSLDAVRTAPG